MTPLKLCTCNPPSPKLQPHRRQRQEYLPLFDRKIPLPEQHMEKMCKQHNYSTEEGGKSDWDSIEMSISEFEIRTNFPASPRSFQEWLGGSKKTEGEMKLLVQAIISQIEESETPPLENKPTNPINPTNSFMFCRDRVNLYENCQLQEVIPRRSLGNLLQECNISEIQGLGQSHLLDLGESVEEELERELVRGLMEENRRLKEEVQRMRGRNQKQQSKKV